MSAIRPLSFLLLLTLSPFALSTDTKDEETLRTAGVKTDPDSLLQYFRSRTLNEAGRRLLEEQIQQLGHRTFAVRERATEALKARGLPAVPYLKAALASTDLETIRRAQRCLDDIDRSTGSHISLAVLRVLMQKPPPSATAVLIGFIAQAEDETVEEALLEALVKLLPSEGKPDATLTAALRDELPARRAAAAYVLGRRTDKATQEDVRKLLADKVVLVRFRAAQGLLVGKDRGVLTALPALLVDAPLNIAWQVEELLARLAGEDAPSVSLGAGEPETRKKSREVWEQWAKKYGEKVDLARASDVRRLLGLTLAIEYNTARIWECGPDGIIRWEIANLTGPMEAWVLPGNRVLLADGNDVTERDFKGTILKTFTVGGSGPTGCQRLPNGNTFVSTYDTVMEFDKAGTKVYSHNIGGSNAIRKHRNGNIIYATNSHIIEIDMTGKRVRSIPIPNNSMWVGLEDIANDRFMIANSSTGQVAEIDATGKILFETTIAGACGVTRLPGGNTLVATTQRIVEVDRAGKVVWEKKTTGYVRRVHRR